MGAGRAVFVGDAGACSELVVGSAAEVEPLQAPNNIAKPIAYSHIEFPALKD